jgi:tetratricopeptide (TPR) repeat protein
MDQLNATGADAQLQRAIALVQNGKAAEARALCESSLKLNPQHVGTLHVLGILAVQGGLLDEAGGYFERAVSLDPKNATHHSNLADVFLASGRYADAIKGYTQALALKPDLTGAHYNRGLAFHETGNPSEAAADYGREIAISGGNAQTYYNRGNAFQDMNCFPEAIASYDRAIDLAPEWAAAYCNRAHAHFAMGNFERAIADYSQTLLLQPDLAETHYSRGLAFQQSRRYADAVADYDRALALSPESAQVHYNRGNALQDMNDCAEAIASYDRAIALESNFIPAYFDRGNALVKLGCYEEAAENYRKTLALDSGHTDARKRILWVAIANSSPIAVVNSLAEDVCAAIVAREAAKLENHRSLLGFRARHDLEQISYLLEGGEDCDGFREAHEALEAIQLRTPHEGAYQLTKNEVDTINRARRHMVRKSADIGIAQGLNPENDWRTLEDEYLKGPPEIVVIDNFLSVAALDELRRFCLASTVWKSEYDNHYLGAAADEGFVSPLMLRISHELRQRMPRIFSDHAFEHLWGFKYDSSQRKGINVHADFARVNLNFWITPEAANLDPQTGGLVIYDVAAPKTWSFQEYNREPSRIYEFLAQQKAGNRRIPYKGNRAVLFNSNLFHETDAVHFREGYENRRINITYLFGRGLAE